VKGGDNMTGINWNLAKDSLKSGKKVTHPNLGVSMSVVGGKTVVTKQDGKTANLEDTNLTFFIIANHNQSSWVEG
jgi:hypothetical protein